MRYDNVFVLSPGRSGSKTFVEACKQLSNYSAAHESRASFLGDERFAYPKNHIEADNRLTWFLGEMERKFSSPNVLYIHLQRDFDQTVNSFLDRLRNSNYRSSIMQAFAHGIVMKPKEWREEEEIELAKFYVRTVQSNIKAFLKDKNSLDVILADDGSTFDRFLHEVDAVGDLDAARKNWKTVFNAR